MRGPKRKRERGCIRSRKGSRKPSEILVKCSVTFMCYLQRYTSHTSGSTEVPIYRAGLTNILGIRGYVNNLQCAPWPNLLS